MAEQQDDNSNSWDLTSWSANKSGVWRRKGMKWGGREREQRISKVFWNAKAHSTDMPTLVMSHRLIILKLFHQLGIKYLHISTRGVFLIQTYTGTSKRTMTINSARIVSIEAVGSRQLHRWYLHLQLKVTFVIIMFSQFSIVHVTKHR